MSHSVEISIKYGGSLEQLKEEIEKTLAIKLPVYESGGDKRHDYYGKLLTMDVELSTNYLDTDRELNFSDFQYVLSTRVGGHPCADRLREIQLPMADLIGFLLSHYLAVEVMVTVDVQYLLARYGGSWNRESWERELE